jgi:Domain of unknown function (DUF4105)
MLKCNSTAEDYKAKSVASWRAFRTVSLIFASIIVFPLAVWAIAALYFDFRVVALRVPLTLAYLLIIALAWFLSGRLSGALVAAALGFAVILVWWLTLRPSETGNWQADDEKMAWAEVNGDRVTIHNFRNCNYRTEQDYTCSWETRSYDLSHLKHLDIAITWWGSPWIAHPIVSFDFGDEGHVAMSIETRDLVGQSYSAIRGFFRQYALIYIAADERDVIRLRTNYRKDEEVYLFRTTATPEQARGLFLQYIDRINDLHRRPEWYNALTNNCTTNIAVSAAASRERRPKWDWRMLLNGKGDEMMYERGQFVTDGLSLPELKARAHINDAARAANGDPDFSTRIRENRPGFGDTR